MKKTPTESKFAEKGTLTPLEFELAGDQLISASPMWEWKPALRADLSHKDLAKDKQYLSATIYSNERLADLVGDGSREDEGILMEMDFFALKTKFDNMEGKGLIDRIIDFCFFIVTLIKF